MLVSVMNFPDTFVYVICACTIVCICLVTNSFHFTIFVLVAKMQYALDPKREKKTERKGLIHSHMLVVRVSPSFLFVFGNMAMPSKVHRMRKPVVQSFICSHFYLVIHL